MTDAEQANSPMRLAGAVVCAAAVLYGASVWLGVFPNVLNWHYYPKVWMLIGCIGLLFTVRGFTARG